MSVHVETGRRRKSNAELNLVPFIDLLSVCIVFLIATAVWVELESVRVDQAVGESHEETDGPPPLRVHLSADGVRVGREEGVLVPRVGADIDWDGVSARIAADRSAWALERQIVLLTDDGLPYRDMIHALDLATAHAYDRPLLGGGPP